MKIEGGEEGTANVKDEEGGAAVKEEEGKGKGKGNAGSKITALVTLPPKVQNPTVLPSCYAEPGTEIPPWS